MVLALLENSLCTDPSSMVQDQQQQSVRSQTPSVYEAEYCLLYHAFYCCSCMPKQHEIQNMLYNYYMCNTYISQNVEGQGVCWHYIGNIQRNRITFINLFSKPANKYTHTHTYIFTWNYLFSWWGMESHARQSRASLDCTSMLWSLAEKKHPFPDIRTLGLYADNHVCCFHMCVCLCMLVCILVLATYWVQTFGFY